MKRGNWLLILIAIMSFLTLAILGYVYMYLQNPLNNLLQGFGLRTPKSINNK